MVSNDVPPPQPSDLCEVALALDESSVVVGTVFVPEFWVVKWPEPLPWGFSCSMDTLREVESVRTEGFRRWTALWANDRLRGLIAFEEIVRVVLLCSFSYATVHPGRVQ